jgi:hypothetical protein
MQLLITYDDQAEAEAAEKKLTGKKRLASDRDDNEVIYNLFGDPTWANFYQLDMYSLTELKTILDQRKAGEAYDQARHQQILDSLGFVQSTYGLKIPEHWL